MLIAVGSAKGSPGATSVALLLAAVWPRPMVVLEADPAGGDLAYRCRAAHGGAVYTDRGLLKLASGVRSSEIAPDTVSNQAQMLACGVHLVQGVEAAAQARGIGTLWANIARACVVADVDVIVDLGRVDRSSAVMPLAQAADWVLPVGLASLESLMHMVEGIKDLAAGLAGGGGVVRILPLLIGPDEDADHDTAELDQLLSRAALPVGPVQPIPLDRHTVVRIEEGEKATGRLGRTLLLRAIRRVAGQIAPAELVTA